ncbi:hypothetical protein ACFQQB_61925 [Nonomuraea rubra]|uniref:hypothetical protein n=1 Tax=Nonomuraea rubra TaxID=46180 RepID=UPI003607F893
MPATEPWGDHVHACAGVAMLSAPIAPIAPPAFNMLRLLSSPMLRSSFDEAGNVH